MDVYNLNCGKFYQQDPLPLPPVSKDMKVQINHFDEVMEPKFDPKIHLDLQDPEFIRLLPDFRKAVNYPKVTGSQGSPFIYSSPFQVLSVEGVRVMRNIVLRHEKRAVPPKFARGQKHALRGLYYLSPFVRDFQNCKELSDHFEKLVGEKLIPHCLHSNVPQVNLSVVGGSGISLDPWHWDSVAYTGVILLNEMEGLIGGELELMKMEKQKGLKMLEEGKIRPGIDTDVISYENPGKMILAQGSEVLHHVTPVLSTHRRISMIMAYSPANCYQRTKSVLDTMRKVDVVHQMADYEHFREAAWHCSYILKGYSENVTYSPNGSDLAPYLRVVAQELNHAADILDSKVDDMIEFYDELNKTRSSDFSACVQKKN